ncbi:MAG: hypothetical protein HFG75_13410 [Hungatella sp.]|nr:hypothetical protein [Hungatella sp.]
MNLSEDHKADSIAPKAIRQGCPDFLLPMKTVEIEIRYELQEGIRLAYLPRQMHKKDFVTMIVNMLLPFKSCSDWFLGYHNFWLDEKRAF